MAGTESETGAYSISDGRTSKQRSYHHHYTGNVLLLFGHAVTAFGNSLFW